MNALGHYVQECDFMFERLHSSVKTKRTHTGLREQWIKNGSGKDLKVQVSRERGIWWVTKTLLVILVDPYRSSIGKESVEQQWSKAKEREHPLTHTHTHTADYCSNMSFHR